MADGPDLRRAYDEYVTRVNDELGPLEPGQYAKWGGRLVKRLSRTEFEGRYLTFTQIRERYDATLRDGDTVNDAVVQLLEDHATELLMKT